MTAQTANGRIRVVHVTEARHIAGTEQSLILLLDHSDRARFEHVVVCRGNGGLAEELGRRGVPWVIIPRHGRVDPIPPLRFAALLVKLRPDLVHIHGARLEALVAHIAGTPVVERKNVYRNAYYRPVLNFRASDRFLNRFVDASITPSAAVRSHFLRRGYKPETLHVVYNGVDPAPQRSASDLARKRHELGVPADAFLVAFAGRLVPVKGVNFLLDALATVRETVCCVIAGSGPLAETWQRRAAALGLGRRVIFTGYRRDVREILACSDVVVVPSLFDTLANVGLEAMAEGKPVIASAVQGMPEVIEHEVTGLLVPPGDPAALARAVAWLAAHPEEARKMGTKARKHTLSRHSPERMAKETERIYYGLLNRTRERDCSWHRMPTAGDFTRPSS